MISTNELATLSKDGKFECHWFRFATFYRSCCWWLSYLCAETRRFQWCRHLLRVRCIRPIGWWNLSRPWWQPRWEASQFFTSLFLFKFSIQIGIRSGHTSSTAQGGGGSFKNKKPIGEVGCCESGMAERSHWWTERCLRSPLFLSLSPTYQPTYIPIYVSIYLSTYLSIYINISLSIDLSTCVSVVQCHSV